MAVEKQKVIITREAKSEITTTCYADMTRFQNTASSINWLSGVLEKMCYVIMICYKVAAVRMRT